MRHFISVYVEAEKVLHKGKAIPVTGRGGP
jgi:hypothetical protein